MLRIAISAVDDALRMLERTKNEEVIQESFEAVRIGFIFEE